MVKNAIIGKVLIAVGLLVVLAPMIFGSDLFVNFVDLGGDKQKVECSGTIDKDTVFADWESGCQVVQGSCLFSTQGFFSDAIGLTDSVELRVLQGSSVVKKEKFDINQLGVNKEVGVSFCAEGNTAELKMFNSDGGLLSSRGLFW